MEGRQTHLKVVSALPLVLCRGCSVFSAPELSRKGKNDVLKRRSYWEWVCWRLVIAGSEAFSTFPL